MSEQPDKNYVAKYLAQAEATSSEAIKNDCLYRVGTQLEIIECDGDTNLSNAEKEAITNTAKVFLNDEM